MQTQQGTSYCPAAPTDLSPPIWRHTEAAPQADFMFAACHILHITILAHNRSLPEDLRNEGGQLPDLLFGSTRLCAAQQGSALGRTRPVFPDSSGRWRKCHQTQRSADSETPRSLARRLILVVRRLPGSICTFSQGMGDKLGAYVRSLAVY